MAECYGGRVFLSRLSRCAIDLHSHARLASLRFPISTDEWPRRVRTLTAHTLSREMVCCLSLPSNEL